MAAIFDFQHIQTSDSIPTCLFVLPDTENMGIAVGILLQSCIEAEILVITFFSRHLGFLTASFIWQYF